MLLNSNTGSAKVEGSMELRHVAHKFVPTNTKQVFLSGLLAASAFSSHAFAQQDSLPQVDGRVEANATLKRHPPSQGATVMAAPEDLTKAKLSSGYLLQMEVYDTPEMDVSLRVDASGYVSVPLIGRVHVGGNTLLEAQDTIAKALVSGEILKTPQVTLNILQFASGSATVLGEVQVPGRIQLLAPRSLGEVLAEAGGETFSAGSDIDVQHLEANGKVSVSRVHYTELKPSNVLQQTTIYPGDTVVVHRAGAIYVLGGVTRPGSYLMVNSGSLNLLEAISLAQGTLLRASVSEVEILRPNGETYSHLKVPLKKMQQGKASPTPLQVNDIIYVPISATKSVFLDAAGLLGAAATASIYAAR